MKDEKFNKDLEIILAFINQVEVKARQEIDKQNHTKPIYILPKKNNYIERPTYNVNRCNMDHLDKGKTESS